MGLSVRLRPIRARARERLWAMAPGFRRLLLRRHSPSFWPATVPSGSLPMRPIGTPVCCTCSLLESIVPICRNVETNAATVRSSADRSEDQDAEFWPSDEVTPAPKAVATPLADLDPETFKELHAAAAVAELGLPSTLAPSKLANEPDQQHRAGLLLCHVLAVVGVILLQFGDAKIETVGLALVLWPVSEGGGGGS